MTSDVVPLIEIDTATLGPAMQALSPSRRAFVFAKVFRGFTNKECARFAGYSNSSANVLTVTGHNIAHDPKVEAAIREETIKLKDSQAAPSIRTLIEIRDDPTAEKAVRRKCAIDLLDRCGFHATSEHTVHVTRKDETSDELVKRIELMAKRLGMTPQQQHALIGSAIITDAEYETVPVEPPPPLTEEEKKAAPKRERENELRRQRRKMTPAELAGHKIKMAAEKSERMKADYLQQQVDAEYEVKPLVAPDDDDISDILGPE